MNPKSYRILIKPVSNRVRCPVCHEEVYSRAGIHPQCAVRQSDPPRLKAKNKGLESPAQAESDSVTPAPAEAGAIVDVPGVATISVPSSN